MFFHNSHSTAPPHQRKPSILLCISQPAISEIYWTAYSIDTSLCSLFPILYAMYCENIINFLLLLFILLSGSEQAEQDPCCRQGYWHKDRGWVGGLHGRDRHFGLLQPPSHCQTAGRLLFWRQTLGKRANCLTERNVLFPHMVLLMWRQGDREAVNLESRMATHIHYTPVW